MREYKTLEGYLTNGLTWKIEHERDTQHLTIVWANGEASEVECLELRKDDLKSLADLFSAAYEVSEPPQLSYAELADLNHTKQVILYGFCTCEDGPKVYDDCPQDGN
jgi:hypothetical protein